MKVWEVEFEDATILDGARSAFEFIYDEGVLDKDVSEVLADMVDVGQSFDMWCDNNNHMFTKLKSGAYLYGTVDELVEIDRTTLVELGEIDESKY